VRLQTYYATGNTFWMLKQRTAQQKVVMKVSKVQ
jgi:hypothetical protein